MKSICKLIVAALLFAMIFAITELKAQDSQDSKIGLTVGMDYVSNYLYRGENFYLNAQNSGMIAPYVSYDVFKTGLSLGIKGEVAEQWFWDERDEFQNTTSFKMMNSINFNVNYMYELKKTMSLNIGGWYYSYQRVHFINTTSGYDPSYFDIYFSAQIDALPLTPKLIVTYSYFKDDDYARGAAQVGNTNIWVWGNGPGKNGDWYIQFGLGHSFELFYKTYFDLEAMVGFYDKNSSGFCSLMGATELTPTNSADISEIDLSAGFSTTAGKLTLSTSFHYVIVPGTQYKYALSNYSYTLTQDIHRFYAKFGVSCSI